MTWENSIPAVRAACAEFDGMVSWGVDAGIRSLPYAPVLPPCVQVLSKITQRLHPNGNSKKLKRTGVFTALPAATLLSSGVKRALISRKRRKILFIEIKALLAEKKAAGVQKIMRKT